MAAGLYPASLLSFPFILKATKALAGKSEQSIVTCLLSGSALFIMFALSDPKPY
jgi:hypothetical protein